MNKSIYVSIIAVSLIFGVIISFQYRSNNDSTAGKTTDRYQELTIEKKQVETDIAQLEEEIGDLTVKIETARQGRTEAADAVISELDKTKLYAGLIPVTGPGVNITMKIDQASQAGMGFYNIRDEDLLKVINDLRGAGAEAISINDQRILATSEVRKAGNHININLVRLSPPYSIKAIGNPVMLESSLEIKGGLVETLAVNGITVDVQQSDQVLVAAYTGMLRFDYAKHVQRG